MVLHLSGSWPHKMKRHPLATHVTGCTCRVLSTSTEERFSPFMLFPFDYQWKQRGWKWLIIPHEKTKIIKKEGEKVNKYILIERGGGSQSSTLRLRTVLECVWRGGGMGTGALIKMKSFSENRRFRFTSGNSEAEWWMQTRGGWTNCDYTLSVLLSHWQISVHHVSKIDGWDLTLILTKLRSLNFLEMRT